ncbi:MAG: Oxidoreductase family, NAD-binding Rossmann fold protein [Parcubacteria group bacterium GW2011_GWA2_43_17]|nr:MAG: Oxidoreductase family, NAD-binding Rossmann fold protein [Parcubacteria group bacterium GW2011_GWA2_43_17]HBR19023.1 dehydrogenase [Phycisphaerales bacterium]
MKKFKAGIIGTGYIGPAHIEALRRLGNVEVAAVAEANQDLAESKARQLCIPTAYGNYKDMLKDKSIDVIHNCTPNFMHLQVNKDILNAGKHCVSEKPLGMNSKESAELVALAKEKGLVNAVNFNYRYYPLVQQARMMVKNGQLGRVFAVQGCYMQDWLLYDTDWNWRLEPKYAGDSRVMGDIGSHWFDLIQFVTGKKIVKVFADLLTLYEYRKKPKMQIETFSGKELKPDDYEKVKINTEDYGHVLLQFDDGSKGMACITHVSAGRKNHIVFELNGTEKSVWWDHERPNELMIGQRNQPNQLQMKDAVLMDKNVKDYAHYPAGHNEGYPSAVKNFCRNVYRYIAGESKEIDFATFEDGHIADCIVDAVMKSDKTGKWIEIE